MKIIHLLAIVGAIGILGCSDGMSKPDKFINKYGKEIIEKRIGKELALWGVKDIVFSQAKVAIDDFGSEFVQAKVTIVPKSGLKFYQLVRPSSRLSSVRLNNSLPYDFSSIIGTENKTIGDEIKRGMDNVRWFKLRPQFYAAEAIDIKSKLVDARVIRLYRAKDGDGNYLPVEGDRGIQIYGDENPISRYSLFDPGFLSVFDGLVSSEMIKSPGYYAVNTKEASDAIEHYVEAVQSADVKIGEMNAVFEKFKSLSSKAYDGRYFSVEAMVVRAKEEIEKESNRKVSKIERDYDLLKRKCRQEEQSIDSDIQKANRDVKDKTAAVQRAVAAVNQLIPIIESQNAGRPQPRGAKTVSENYAELERLKKEMLAAQENLKSANLSLAAQVARKTATQDVNKKKLAEALNKAKAEAVAAKNEKDAAISSLCERVEAEHDAEMLSAKQKLTELMQETLKALNCIR